MCLFPVKVLKYETTDPLTGEVKVGIKFGNPEKLLSICNYDNMEVIDLPCGCCVECLLEHSNEWSYRICNEAQYHKQNIFITLTYAENPVSLNKRDLQLFIKRLRRRIEPVKIRYFACGEYGKKGKRPHYHIIIFGWCPDDLIYFFTDKKGTDIYLSDFLASLWSYGFISCAFVGVGTSKYVSKYMQKLNDIPDNVVKPFTIMSLKPGIGTDYFNEHKDACLLTDKIYYNGNYRKLPRYYLKLAERQGYDLTELKSNRVKKAHLCSKDEDELEARRNKYIKLLDKARK